MKTIDVVWGVFAKGPYQPGGYWLMNAFNFKRDAKEAAEDMNAAHRTNTNVTYVVLPMVPIVENK